MRRALVIIFLCFASLKAEEVKIIACENSLEMVDWGLQFIGSAEQSIDFAACFFGGSVLQRYLAVIEEQMKKHPRLQVYILMMPTFLEPEDKTLLHRLEGQYKDQFHVTQTSSVIHMDKELYAVDNHVKMLVVDERYFTMGGTNLDDALCTEGTTPNPPRTKQVAVGSKLPSGGRDQDIVGRSPEIAKQMRLHLHKLIAVWDDYNKKMRFTSKDPDYFAGKNHYFPMKGTPTTFVESFESSKEGVIVATDDIQIILSGPMHRPNRITQKYCELIRAAKEEIIVGNLHFAPADPMMKDFMNASKRGVKTTVITNGIHSNAPECTAFLSWPNRLNYVPVRFGRTFQFWEKALCKKARTYNSHFYEYDVKDILYHKKVMVVDRRYFVIGSYNLGLRSDQGDYEFIFVIDSKELSEKAIKVLERDIQFSREVSQKQMIDWYFDPVVAYKAKVEKQFNVFF